MAYKLFPYCELVPLSLLERSNPTTIGTSYFRLLQATEPATYRIIHVLSYSVWIPDPNLLFMEPPYGVRRSSILCLRI